MRLKTLTLCLAFISAYHNGIAQKETKTDSLLQHKILLIPYDPHYYLSDADRDISDQSNQSATNIRSLFRSETDRNIYRALAQHQSCISLMEDSDANLYNDAVELLSKTGFAYDTPTIKEKKKLKEKLHWPADDKTQSDSRTASQYVNDDVSKKYMKAILYKPELLQNMATKYDFNLFVFVTQFEIKTNYASCIDIANKIYKREIFLHFTVYDSDGNLVAGNFSKTSFPSDSNNANKIIGECFPQLAEGIVNSIE